MQNSNPTEFYCIRMISVCFRQIGFVTFQTLFAGDQACRWSDYLSFQNERREKAINLALVCVEKATLTGKVKSDMSSNRAPGQRMMICQLGSDISQLQGLTSERGCHAKLDFLKGGKYSRVNSTTNLFLVIWYQGVLPHQIMATHFLKPENKYLTQKTSLKLINSKCLEDGLVFTFQGFPFQSKHMCGAYCDVCEWLREAFKYPYWRNRSFKTE